MKHLFWLVLLIPVIAFTSFNTTSSTSTTEKEEVHWVDFNTASQNLKVTKRKVFVDVYTDWCHYCKVMDQKTFSNAKVAAYLNEHFYAVKFNAEGKEEIQFDGKTFKNQGKTHDLSLAWGVRGYPTGAFLDENERPLLKVPGYLEPKEFLLYLHFVAEEHYKTQSFEQYAKSH